MPDIRNEDQHAMCYWFTGLSGAGKSTLSGNLALALQDRGYRTSVLDGDHLRQGLNKGLGYTREDRAENVRRIAEVAGLMVGAGLIVLVSAIAPYRKDRQAARRLFKPGRFFEVFVDTPLATCVERDPKGLYRQARNGQITHLTGWDDPYEIPQAPDVVIATAQKSLAECIGQLTAHCLARQSQARDKEAGDAFGIRPV